MQYDSPVADRITGGILFVLGISMLVGGYTMDRLEIRQIHPASIPGLVPMGLGAAMAICALLLILSARRHHSSVINNITDNTDGTRKPDTTGSYSNLGVTAFLCVIYAAGLVGNIPFVAATALFIFSFSVWFMWPKQSENNTAKFRVSLFCAIYAATFAIGISLLFRYGFLVRLP